MKKFLILVLLASLLTACGGEEDNSFRVTSFYPSDKALDVLVDNETTMIEINFSQDITSNPTLTLHKLSGSNVSGELTRSARKLIFSPHVDLDFGTTYEVVLEAWDSAGEKVTKTWQFRTELEPIVFSSTNFLYYAFDPSKSIWNKDTGRLEVFDYTGREIWHNQIRCWPFPIKKNERLRVVFKGSFTPSSSSKEIELRLRQKDDPYDTYSSVRISAFSVEDEVEMDATVNDLSAMLSFNCPPGVIILTTVTVQEIETSWPTE